MKEVQRESVRTMEVGAASAGFLLCCMCDRTRWLAARAAIRESSPASTADPTICANLRELSPEQCENKYEQRIRFFCPGNIGIKKMGVIVCACVHVLQCSTEKVDKKCDVKVYNPPASAPGALEAPLTPQMSRHPAWAGKCVPPPTVPTSMEGIVTLTCKLLPSYNNDSNFFFKKSEGDFV